MTRGMRIFFFFTEVQPYVYHLCYKCISFLDGEPYSRYSADENIASDETVGVVLEEAEIVDCDADVEADDDNIQYHLYAVNRDDNTVAYKVMQVSNNDREDNNLSITPVNNTVQVLTSPLNGQLYVLSNGSEVVTSETARVVPSVAKLQIEGPQNIVTSVKKVSHPDIIACTLRHCRLLVLKNKNCI